MKENLLRIKVAAFVKTLSVPPSCQFTTTTNIALHTNQTDGLRYLLTKVDFGVYYDLEMRGQ